MRGLRILLISLLLAGTTACSNRTEVEEGQAFGTFSYQAPTRSGIESLRKTLEGYKGIATPENRDSKFNPEVILPQIHPWFAPGKGLSLKKPRDSRQAYLLKPIPAPVLQELDEALYPDSVPVPLMILRSSFWRRVAALEGELHFGFKGYEARNLEVGVYFSGSKTLLFDTFAEYGTLTHELRHHRQFTELARTHDPEEKAEGLSEDCLDQFGHFLGEMDSTTAELPEWSGVFSTLDLKPAEARLAKEASELPFDHFYLNLLTANLNYPSIAATWVAKSDCPAPIKNAATALSEQSIRYTLEARKPGIEFTGIRTRFGMTSLFLNHSCQTGTSAGMDAEPRDCERAAKELAQTDPKAAPLLNELEAVLARGPGERMELARNKLNALPDSYRQVLCKNVLAFSLFVDCGL